MGNTENNSEDSEFPESGKVAKISRGALQTVGGAIPFAGGFFSAIAGVWSENEQDKVLPPLSSGHPAVFQSDTQSELIRTASRFFFAQFV